MKRLFFFFVLLLPTLLSPTESHTLKAQSPRLTLSEVQTIGIGTVNSVAWSPTADVLAVGGSDNVRLYNSALEEVAYFDDQPLEIDRVVWSPDGTKIAAQARGLDVQIRDGATGDVLAILRQPAGVHAIAWSPDSQYLAVSSGISTEHQVSIWNIASAEIVSAFQNEERIISIDWSSDGRRIVAGSWDDHVYVWDVNTGELLAQLDNRNVSAVAWGPDGARFASGSSSRPTVIVWDANSYEPIFTSELSRYVETIAWKPDSTQLAINNSTGDVLILDAATGELVQTIELEADIVHSLSWSWDGSKLAVLTRDNLIAIWDFATQSYSATFRGYVDLGLAVAVDWRPNSEQVAVVFFNRPETKIFDARSGLLVNELPIPLDPVSVAYNQILLWSPDGTRLMCDCGGGDRLFIWNMDGRASEPMTIRQDRGVYSPSWSPDGRYIAAVKLEDVSTAVQIWDSITGELLSHVDKPMDSSYLWSADSTSIVFQNDEQQWQIWDHNRQVITSLPVTDPSRGRIVSETGSNRIIRADCDSQQTGCQLLAWNLLSGESTPLLYDASIDFIQAMEWSPDSKWLAGSAFRTIHVWDTQTWTLAAEVNLPSRDEIIFSWSSDSTRIAVISGGVVRILQLESAL